MVRSVISYRRDKGGAYNCYANGKHIGMVRQTNEGTYAAVAYGFLKKDFKTRGEAGQALLERSLL